MLINESSSLGDTRNEHEDDDATMWSTKQSQVGLNMLLKSRDPLNRRLASFAHISLNRGLKKNSNIMELKPPRLHESRLPESERRLHQSPLNESFYDISLPVTHDAPI